MIILDLDVIWCLLCCSDLCIDCGLMRLRVVFNSVVHGYYVFVVGGVACVVIFWLGLVGLLLGFGGLLLVLIVLCDWFRMLVV